MASKKGRKAEKRLQARRKDYSIMLSNSRPNQNYDGFKRPGSNKK